MDSEDCARNFDIEDKNPKRRMKTPFQLEALERLYAEDRYPTEAVRAELSLHLNLSDKQLQMWFCHRRLKDKNYGVDDLPPSLKKQKTQPYGSSSEAWASPNPDFGTEENHALAHGTGYRKEAETNYNQVPFQSYYGAQEADSMKTRRNDALVRVWESTVVPENSAFRVVKSRLGAQTCDDGPTLGVEFDALPTGAFGSAIGAGQQVCEGARVAILHAVPKETAKGDEDPETCSPQVGGFGVHLSSEVIVNCRRHGEQKVADEQNLTAVDLLSEQLNTKEDGSRLNALLNSNAHSNRLSEMAKDCSPLEAYLPSDAQICARHLYASRSTMEESVTRSFLSSIGCKHGSRGADGHGLDDDNEISISGHRVQDQVGVCQSVSQMMAPNQPSLTFPMVAAFHPERLGTTWRAGDLKTRREFGRQDILKRKREAQQLRELEKQDRDKRKEEERAARERQREEERIQREHKREIERQQKKALKESKRMERQQQKEEVRRAKEAAKLKAASERAAARKVSRELMDKIDDDELELLEREASGESSRNDGMEDLYNSGLPDVSNELLKTFPPSAVKMSTPLTICMRSGLKHAFGHLFMVWRFLTAFADVIGLWPFTLDEFEGALHDFDSRLLSEIHISLVKMIVKNIEDAAQATTNGSLSSQNGTSLMAGGHPQILEAAAKWGFSISEWGQHINSTTWPDILRQFALAAGYGPKWEKIYFKPANAANVTQVKGDLENSVTSLRSGTAAANAVAHMLGKGVGLSRKYRPRLTPGTVKYAAFHVLSLEGGKGLSTSEVAEKIQKSGLRDLKTSKTPEASIAAALSRDVNLFERVAPSTYCVRPAYRKDADDIEDVLQSAKDRMQLFQSGFLDVDDAENIVDEADDIEKESDYDSDGRDVENGVVSPSDKKDVDADDEMHTEDACLDGLVNDTTEMVAVYEGEAWVQGLMEGEYSDLSIEERLKALVALVTVVNEGNMVRNALEARMEAAGTLKRQSWAEAQLEKRRQKEEQMLRLQSSAPPNRCHGSCSPTNLTAKKSPIVNATEDKLSEPQANTQGLENEVGDCVDTFVGNISLDGQELQIGFQCCTNLSVLEERSRADRKARLETWVGQLYAIRSGPLGLDRRRNRYWQFICGDGRDPSYGRIYFESNADGHWEVIDSEEALDAFMLSLDTRGTREAGLHAALLQVEAVLRQGMGRAAIIKSCLDQVGPARICSDFRVYEIPELLRTNSKAPRSMGEQCFESLFEVETNEKYLPRKQSLFENLKSFWHWIWIDSSQKLFATRTSKSRKMVAFLPVCGKCHNVYEAIDRECQICHPTPSKCPSKLFMAPHKKRPWWDTPPRLHVLKAQIVAIEDAIPPEALKSDWEAHYRKSWASYVKNAMSSTELFHCCSAVKKMLLVVMMFGLHLLSNKILHGYLLRNGSIFTSCYGEALLTLERQVGPECFSECTPELSSSDYNSLFTAVDDADDASWIPRTSAAVGLRVIAFDAALSRRPELRRKYMRDGRDRNNGNASSH